MSDDYYDGVPTGYYVRETLDGEELVMTASERLARALCHAEWDEINRDAWNTCINEKGREHYRMLARVAMSELGVSA